MTNGLPGTLSLTLMLLLAAGCAVTSNGNEADLSDRNVDDELDALEPLLEPATTLLLGEVHGTAESPALVARIARHALRRGHPVTVALEIPLQESARVSAFMESQGTPADRAQLLAGGFWQSSVQDGRASLAMVGLIEEMRALAAEGAPVQVALFDDWSVRGAAKREPAMAQALATAVSDHPSNFTVVLAGNVHARLSRGSVPGASDSMAYRASQMIPQARFVALKLVTSGGTTWMCSSGIGCGEFSLAGRERTGQALVMNDSPGRDGYHGRFHVGGVQASVPAVEARRVATNKPRPTSTQQASPTPVAETATLPRLEAEPGSPPGDWPQWMGPRGNAAIEAGLLERGTEVELAVDWRRPIGAGYSSVTVANGRAITLESDELGVWIIALDVDTGRELWRSAMATPDQPEEEEVGRPLSTPASDGELVFATHPSGRLFAFEADTGTLLWSHDLVEEFGASLPSYGMSSSPLLCDGSLFVLVGGDEDDNFVEFDPSSGKVRRRVGQSESQSYATPVLGEVRGQRQLVVPSADVLYAVRPDSGELIWSYEGLPFPDRDPLLLGEGRIFMTMQEFAAMLEVADDSSSVRELWRVQFLQNSYSPSVAHGDAVYGIGSGRLYCIDVRTGNQLWQHRIGMTGSMIRVDDHLVVYDVMGGQVLLVGTDTGSYTETASLQVFAGGQNPPTPPSFGAGRIFVRGRTEIAAIRPLVQ